MSIVCVAVRPGLFKDRVKFCAYNDHEAVFGTFFGDKVFYMKKGDFVTLKMSKNDMWEVGDEVKSLVRLVNMSNQTNFCWKWA